MVHYLSGFVARDLSGLAVERLFRFISSIQGGDIDGSGKVSAKSQDEPVQKSLRQMEAEEADTERGGRAARDFLLFIKQKFYVYSGFIFFRKRPPCLYHGFKFFLSGSNYIRRFFEVLVKQLSFFQQLACDKEKTVAH